MIKYITLVVTVFLLTPLTTWSQQELQVSQYMFNQLLVNPAYAGTQSYGSASLLHRSQWVSMDESPVSQVLSLETPLGKSLGGGLLVTNDSHGIINELSASANLGYHFNLTSETKLALAARIGVSSYSADFTQLDYWDADDPVYTSTNIENEFVPKFGFGAYFYNEKWFAGLSVPTIIAPSDDKLSVTTASENYFSQHFYASGGYAFELSPILVFRPSVLLKYENAAPLEADINANFLINKKLWLGLGYRTGDALVGMVEYNFTNRLRAGYAYDFTTTEIRNYSNGSHEIMIAFDFGEDLIIKKTSPRYF
ncbi:MAG: type IX secretion system membrane protein PorP/SprF [Flavobacteriales bacterium]